MDGHDRIINIDEALRECNGKKTGRPIIHGDSHTRFYEIYRGMLKRCNNKNHMYYSRYGGRGIKCLWNNYLEFKNDMYKSYLEHCKLYGEKNTTIDRTDNDGNYCKENCRWVTYREQIYNQKIRDNSTRRFVYVNGNKIPLSEYCEKNNLKYTTILRRIQRGWNMNDVIKNDIIYSIVYKGKKYRSLNNLCIQLGIKFYLVKGKMNKGMSLESAVDYVLYNK